MKYDDWARKRCRRSPVCSTNSFKKGQAQDVCLLFYTSGTTSLPKGALLTHYNMLTMGQNLMRVDPCTPDDDFVSYLPFAWIGEQMMSISCGLLIGYTINFPEEPRHCSAERTRNRPARDVCASAPLRAVYSERPRSSTSMRAGSSGRPLNGA